MARLGVAMVVALGVACGTSAAFAQSAAEKLHNQSARNAGARFGGYGESFCWRAAYNEGCFVKGYEAFGDAEWLDWGVKYYDLLLSRMSTGPDGYKGWIGPYIYDKKVWCDVHVGDSILLDKMLEFSELVLKREPALKAKHGEAAQKYVDVARKHLIEKWDRRGTWREDGPFGAYVAWNHFGEPNELKNWTVRPEIPGATLSLPFNKQNDMAMVCMKLWRITGEKSYRDKAEKIYAFMRSRFQYLDDHYVWNYWEPFGPWDVDLEKGDTRHWMNVHRARNYQAGEVHQIARAYHTGIVFGPADIQRITRTNLEVMWNKNTPPTFYNSNVTFPGRGRAKSHIGDVKHSGTLWTGLLDFNQTVRDLYAPQVKKARGTRGDIDRAYFENVTMKRPPSLKRRWAADDIKTPEFLLSECRSITAACVLPHVVRRGARSIVLSKAGVPVDLEVAVYSADGKEKLLVLHKGKVDGGTDGHAGIFILQWDGTDPAGKRTFDGAYRMRWTVPDGYREFPLTVTDK
jgi:hypothetical protein